MQHYTEIITLLPATISLAAALVRLAAAHAERRRDRTGHRPGTDETDKDVHRSI